MRKMILITAILCMVATGALAGKLPAKKATKPAANYDGKSYLMEGFESVVPPAGWTLTSTNTASTWGQGTSGLEGIHEAHIAYDGSVPQDETLSVVHAVDAGENLFFWTMGSQYWATSADFTVLVDGVVVYDFLNDTNYPGAFTWFPVEIDMSAYAGTTVTVDFNYAGLDGADQHFDAVVFGAEGWTPPPPPDVDFCGDLLDVTGVGMFYGDTCDGMNLVESLECGAYGEAGLEDYYEIMVPAGGSFTASVTNTADGALWVLGECSAPGGAFTCLGYADDTLAGDTEVVSYTNASSSDEVVYLVIDSYGADSCGTYEMLFEGTGGAVATDKVSMGAVKAMYR